MNSNTVVQDHNHGLRENRTPEKPLTGRSYLLGLLVILAAAYSQYLMKGFGHVLRILIVYGVPLLVISWLWGSTIIRKAFRRTPAALEFGLGFFGAFTLLGMIAATAAFYIIVRLDPGAVSLLHRPNPLVHIPPQFAWIMVGLSLILVGPVEEYLFRGFVYGGLLSLFRNRHWFVLALTSSLLFAAAHLYYAVIYGIASLVLFIDLTAFGLAMAAAFYFSGGNLLAPALIHGAYDALGFAGVATSPTVGILLRSALTLTGLIVAVTFVIPQMRGRKSTKDSTLP